MNPLFLILISIILIFSLFIYLSSLYRVYETTEELYEHPLTCTPSQTLCIPTKSFYYQTLASSLTPSEVIKDINQWLTSKDLNEKPSFEVKYNEKTHNYQAYALNDIKTNDRIIGLSDKSIFHKFTISELNFNEKLNKTDLINDQYSLAKLNLTNTPTILTISLAYHLYHIESSIFKPWLQTFSTDIQSFFARMTLYEYNTFIRPNQEIYSSVKDYFEMLEKEWKGLEYLLKKRLSQEERASFFNNHPFTKSDFIYMRIIAERNGWYVANSQEIILFPLNDLFIRKNIENEISYTTYIKQQEIKAIDNQTVHLNLISDRNFSKGEPIYQSFTEPRGFLSALLYGQMPKFSFLDCIVIDVYYYENIFNLDENRKKFLKWASENGKLCLSLNPYAMARLKIIGALMNMDANEIKECFFLVEKASNLEEQYDIFLRRCANPEWKIEDPRQIPLKSLNSSLTFYEGMREKAKSYKENREYNRKDSRNAGTLLDYIEQKVILNKKLIEKVKKMTNNRLEDFKEVDKDIEQEKISASQLKTEL